MGRGVYRLLKKTLPVYLGECGDICTDTLFPLRVLSVCVGRAFIRQIY
jgi:hypothetical protein